MVSLLVVGFLALVVFVVLREFWTWYWKQSEQVELLKSIAKSLQLLEERGRARPPAALPAAANGAPKGWSSVPPSVAAAQAPSRP